MFSRNGPYGASRVICIAKRQENSVTAKIATGSPTVEIKNKEKTTSAKYNTISRRAG